MIAALLLAAEVVVKALAALGILAAFALLLAPPAFAAWLFLKQG